MKPPRCSRKITKRYSKNNLQPPAVCSRPRTHSLGRIADVGPVKGRLRQELNDDVESKGGADGSRTSKHIRRRRLTSSARLHEAANCCCAQCQVQQGHFLAKGAWRIANHYQSAQKNEHRELSVTWTSTVARTSGNASRGIPTRSRA